MSTTEKPNATTQAIAEWVKIFPRQTTETYIGSVTFMKQLTVVAISLITFERGLFPEINFTEENFGGIRLKILKKYCPDDLAQFVSTSLVQAFEAFDNKYLQELALCIYDGRCDVDNLIEYHKFEFSYTSAGVSMQSRGRNGRFSFHFIRERTLKFLQNITAMLADTRCRLPDTCDVSLQLFYNDDAPEGYQVAGFQAPSEEHALTSLDTELILGTVSTDYHSVTGRTNYRDVVASNEPISTLNPPGTSFDDDEGVERWRARGRVRCDCKATDDTEDHLELLTCQVCAYQQHAVCYGVRHARVTSHVCARCGDAAPQLAHTDPELHSKSQDRRERTCIFRRALWHCYQRGRVSGARLARLLAITAAAADSLMRVLDSRRLLLPQKDPTAPRQVNLVALRKTMDKFFPPKDTSIVDRLAEETLSQPTRDPLGEVLNPTEKMALQRDKPTVVLNNPKRIPEDSTMKKYREAYSSSQPMDEDLPLNIYPGEKREEKEEKRANKRKQSQVFNMFKSGVKTKRVKPN